MHLRVPTNAHLEHKKIASIIGKVVVHSRFNRVTLGLEPSVCHLSYLSLPVQVPYVLCPVMWIMCYMSGLGQNAIDCGLAKGERSKGRNVRLAIE